MSHFSVLVLVEHCGEEDYKLAEKLVNTALAPTSEHLEVPEYERECTCGAYESARKEAERVTGLTWMELQEAYENIMESERLPWGEHTALYVKTYNKTLDHLLTTKDYTPFPGCSACRGEGRYISTHNPKAEWECYEIGGRWAGILDKGGEVHEKDDKWADPLYRPEEYGLKGCIKKVQYILGNWSEDLVTSAIITPEGDWHKVDSVLAAGPLKEYENFDEWAAKAKGILEEHKGTTAIVVDCHV